MFYRVENRRLRMKIDPQSSILYPRSHKMGSGLFITGTDTGVGKTFFACGLARVVESLRLSRRCHEAGGNRLRGTRWRALSRGRHGVSRKRPGVPSAIEKICPVPFAANRWRRVSPPNASGVRIDIDHLLTVLRRNQRDARHYVSRRRRRSDGAAACRAIPMPISRASPSCR